MTTIFHDIIHNEMEVQVDGMIFKLAKAINHVTNLRKLFIRLRK